ncbi:XdhC family protein [uncultured Rhodoblastus sp.]|uniref:XdhC family protein n=1 Tax=uncultured Rhodoblastus sp. TaxID=543037 RepID=UPI0025EC6CB2|nr:XdhC family protein [uncultured Rhodoblastus sp.]
MLAKNLFALNAEIALRRPAILVTDLAAGAQRLVRRDEAGRDQLAGVLEQSFQSGASGVVTVDGAQLFIHVHLPCVRLVIVGAVHIAQVLAPMARLAGLEVAVVDPRTAFASPERFPEVDLIAQWPQDALPALRLDRRTAVVLLTHDPRIDDPGLVAALDADCFYIGALGSKKTHAKRIERLRAAGIGPAALARIHAPVGIDIGALTPPEIAVSILAELIAAQGRKALRAEEAA